MLAAAAVALYAFAAVRYLSFWRLRRSLMLLGMTAAFVLLAEAMIAVTFAPNWHATWWEWHVLMLVAFGLVAWSAQRQWHEERFADIYLQDTVSGVRDMSILFADLEGFTRFSEQHESQDVTAMLNAYFEVAVPVVVQRFGGDIDRIIGDAVMVNVQSPWRSARSSPAGGGSSTRVAIRDRQGGVSERRVAAVPRGGQQRPGIGQPPRSRRRSDPHRHR